MLTEIFSVVVPSMCTLIGTFGGILVSGKLTNYRIEQLEKRVAEHNNYAKRMPVLEEKVQVMNHRISDLEEYHK